MYERHDPEAQALHRVVWENLECARGRSPLASADHSARACGPICKCRPSATRVHQVRQATAFCGNVLTKVIVAGGNPVLVSGGHRYSAAGRHSP